MKLTRRRRGAKEKKKMHENELATIAVDAGLHIHKKLGPGLLESAYHAVLVYELRRRGLNVETQLPVPLMWEGVALETAFRADVVVENRLLIELKSIDEVLPVHKKQVLTYLRLMELRLGLLMNFGTELFKDGVSRIANGLQ
jgi:GxxExxY protein